MTDEEDYEAKAILGGSSADERSRGSKARQGFRGGRGGEDGEEVIIMVAEYVDVKDTDDPSTSSGSSSSSSNNNSRSMAAAAAEDGWRWRKAAVARADGDTVEVRAAQPPQWELRCSTKLTARVQVPRPLSLAPSMLLGAAISVITGGVMQALQPRFAEFLA
eukprot:CAMPEP_0197582712 /NCGR_PEP_ID=MMETSP1326-20131121/5856_1 /TAXON_ID=1155430 /ORGANISM="Genus nov. species nov., Strain RCC2288" /LENGTH=161 /DNA_ID=CAMNT_0043146837 /DNA_START=79 /DNA_END=560 /DNA_ORIENTATION=-